MSVNYCFLIQFIKKPLAESEGIGTCLVSLDYQEKDTLGTMLSPLRS